jgi:hypothetical protein
MTAKYGDLLRCKNKGEVKRFAKKHALATKENGNEITVGGWTCVFEGERFLYIK